MTPQNSRFAAAGLTASLAAVQALAVQTGYLALVLATTAVAQFLIAWAPAPADRRGRAIDTPQIEPVLIAGLTASVLAFLPGLLIGAPGTRGGMDGAVSTGVFAGMLPAVAAGVIVAILAQLARRGGRAGLVRSLSTVVSLGVFAGCASAWIGAARASGGTAARVTAGGEVVTVACVAMAFGVAAWSAPGRRAAAGIFTLVVGALAATGAGMVLHSPLPTWFAATVGAAAAGFAVIGLVVGQAWTHGRGHTAERWGFPGALAFAIAGPLVYIGAQLASTMA